MKSISGGGMGGIAGSIGAIASAGAGACAGGVCAVGGSAAAGLLSAGSAGGLAGMAAASGAPIFVQPDAGLGHPGLPWWAKLSVCVLVLSIAYTCAAMRNTPKMAMAAAFGGLLVLVAELRWLPGGLTVEYLAIAIGVVPLVWGPLVLQIRFGKLGVTILRWISGALAIAGILAAIWLQFAMGLHPCPLCWVEREALAGIAVGVFLRQNWLIFAEILLGLSATMAQLIEMQNASTALSHVCSLLSGVAETCGETGARLLGPAPLGIWAAALFCILWVAAFGLFAQRRTDGSGVLS
ncbi:MAG: disulfide bond formation protein B [Acidithiobacillus ferrivorans]